LRAALEVAGMGRFELDLVSGVITGDARMEQVLGPSSIGGPPVRTLGEALALVHPDDQELVRTRLEAALNAGTDLRLEFRMLRAKADGPDIRWLSFLGRVEHEDAVPVRLFGVVGDVTDRRSEDAARLRSQKREAIGTLAGGIAHDFNNIISAIWSNASVAQTEMRAGVSPETSISEIMRGAERAADVVRRLLSFSREEEPVRVPFDLGEVAREACELVRPTLDANVTLHSPRPRRLPEVHGSSGQLHQVVVNLVGNAGHAAADGGGQIWVTVDTIEVGATGPASSDAAPVLPAGRYVRMRVRDDGPGIAPEVMPRIFDPFFTTKAAGEGTGLGLAASQAIIRSHGGDITAETLPGNAGAVFTVVLPAGEADAPSATAEHASTDDTPSSAALPHVLFVDDDPALAKLAARALPLHGCAVTAFTDAAAGLSALRADPAGFDALVVDLAMPGMNGLDLLQAARDVRPDLALILSSGYLTPANQALAEQLGVSAVLHKPCSVGAIAAAVRDLTATKTDRREAPPA
ncbi:MAG: response regulator, partial [Solirubrobacteraceae bacterium]|nr:response regulator [Solirubrobacteraceae bacterium]